MGLREKARKSLEANEDEIDAPVLLKVDAAEREEAKARETQLRKELEDARKLSDAKTAQIARQDDTIHGLQTRVKDLEAASAIAERDAKKAVKELEGEIKEAREELQDLRKNRPPPRTPKPRWKRSRRNARRSRPKRRPCATGRKRSSASSNPSMADTGSWRPARRRSQPFRTNSTPRVAT